MKIRVDPWLGLDGHCIVKKWRRLARSVMLISISSSGNRGQEPKPMTPEEIRTLFDYNAWANHRSLEAAAAVPNEQFTKPLGSSFPSVRDTLAHICGAEWVWHERFQGNSPSSLPDLSKLNTAAELRVHWLEQESKLLGFVSRLTQADLDHVMEYK